jgi:hypothetical protein
MTTEPTCPWHLRRFAVDKIREDCGAALEQWRSGRRHGGNGEPPPVNRARYYRSTPIWQPVHGESLISSAF